MAMTWSAIAGLAAASTVACSPPPRTPEEEAAYRRCLAAAEAEREQVAKRLCPKSWDTCEHRERIMAGFAAAQRRCR